MSGSTFGNIFKITTWGESHGPGVGVVVDGCPAGLRLDEADVQAFLDRRKPGASRYATQRKESDSVEILSGLFEGRTTGTPISMLVRNTSQRSSDYSDIASYYRPGHADYTFDQNTVSGITAVAGAPPDARRSGASPPVRSPPGSWLSWESQSPPTHRRSAASRSPMQSARWKSWTSRNREAIRPVCPTGRLP